MRDPLAEIWARADAREPVFTADEVAAWPDGDEATLVSLGVLKRFDNAATVVCDACPEGHLEEVVFIESPPGSGVRAYIHCPEAGRVAVPLERLKQWSIDFHGLASTVAAGLDLAGQVEEIVPGRVWSLGKATFGGRSREIFLGRGITWEDAPEVFGRCERLNGAPAAVVLVPGELPQPETEVGDGATPIPLKLVMAYDGSEPALDRDYIAARLTKGSRRAPVKALATFPAPAGTTWSEVSLWVSDTGVTVSAKRRRREFSFEEAGFEEKRRGGVPDGMWTLLKVFAIHGGLIPFDSPHLEQSTRTNLKQYVSVLRDRIRALIPGIDGDPIPFGGKPRSWRTAFGIQTEEGVIFHVPAGTMWPQVTIALTKNGSIQVSVPATERRAEVAYTEEAHRDVARPEWAEQEGEIARVYDLRSLRLADEDGRSNAAGDALLDVLRSGGTIHRPMDDDAMIELGGVLTKLMPGASGKPFDFAPLGEKWVALFHAQT